MKLVRVMGLCFTVMASSAGAMAATTVTQPVAACDQWTGCDFSALAKDKTVAQSVKFEKDPIGLAATPSTPKANVMKALTGYAQKNRCDIYVLAMQDLIKGLFKGSDVSGKKADRKTGQQTHHGQGMRMTSLTDPMKSADVKQAIANKMKSQQENNKYLLVSADKAQCVKKLGFKLPLKKIQGKQGDRS